MKCRTLQENLRRTLWERIDAGTLTGLHLAEQAGFAQAHISNFLNRKRGLSLAGLDRILTVQHLSVLDLIDSEEVNKRASILPPSEDEFDNVAVTEPQIAATHAQIIGMHVKEIVKFKKSFLKRIKHEIVDSSRANWDRFVIIKAEPQEAASMYPRMQTGATVLLDRHYSSLTPYRKGESNIYAVRKDESCAIRYVEVASNHLLLRPHNPAAPVEILTIEQGLKPNDYIVGRVCYVGSET
jgi:transcriptional regulator with XRE-family HTH domain